MNPIQEKQIGGNDRGNYRGLKDSLFPKSNLEILTAFQEISHLDTEQGLPVYLYQPTNYSHPAFKILNGFLEDAPSLKIKFIVDAENLNNKVNGAYNPDTHTLSLRIDSLEDQLALTKLIPTILHEGDHLKRQLKMFAGEVDPFYGEILAKETSILNPANFYKFAEFCCKFGMSSTESNKIYQILNQELPSGGTLIQRVNSSYGEYTSLDEQSASLISAKEFRKISEQVEDPEMKESFLQQSRSYLALSLLFAYRNFKLSKVGAGLESLAKTSNSLSELKILGQVNLSNHKINYLNLTIAGKILLRLPLVKFNDQDASKLTVNDVVAEGLKQFQLLGEASLTLASEARKEILE